MNTKYLILLISLLSVLGLSAQENTEIVNARKLKDDGFYLEASRMYHDFRVSQGLKGKQLLDVLLPEAECYYMLDDYQQLDSVTAAYTKCFRESREELGDSLDVYKAFFHKILGNKYYGKIDDETIEGLYAKFRAASQYGRKPGKSLKAGIV